MPAEPPTPDDVRARAAIGYIRAKVDQLLKLMGTLPLRAEELDDDTLLEMDPIGIIAGSFAQILAHLEETNHDLNLARNEIRAIFDALEAAVVVINPDGTLADCNRLATAWFFTVGEGTPVIGMPLRELCALGAPLCQPRAESTGEFEFTHDGRHFHAIVSHVLDDRQRAAKVVYLVFDITRQKSAEAGLRLYARVFEHTGEGILITDRDNRIVEVNAAFQRITGYGAEQLLGRNPNVLKSGLHDDAFYAAMWAELNANGFWKGELYDRTADGGVIPLLQSIAVVRDGNGEVSHYIAIVSDISHLKETQSRLDFLAHHDVLTGLPNRLLFNDRLEQAVIHARRDATRFALLFIDLDRFKYINDSLGHHVGDLVLVEVARRLSNLVRRSDTVARLGGDEFVVLLERIGDATDAQQLAAKIVGTMTQPFELEGRDLHLGCSVGYALFPEDGPDAIPLLKNADAAMYRAKESGREGVARFSSELSDQVDERIGLETALRVALRQRQFVLHYQPIVDLERARVIAAEALVRWPGAPAGVAGPGQFIPLLEETRLILPLGRWVLREAVRRYRAWREAGLELDYVSVNVCAAQLATHDFAEVVLTSLAEHGIDGERLQLELTENALMRDVERSRTLLRALRERGVRIAIDDFGTGYSSLAYLKQLPIDHLKIDRSFVRDLPDDANDAAIATAIVGLADTLGLDTIAEGIESAEQERFLRALGCLRVQGFRYAPALAGEAFHAYCHNFSLAS
jgi:diguanylate cyclase (GGDEF)-like protein/PAS domain S-box-containing protein